MRKRQQIHIMAGFFEDVYFVGKKAYLNISPSDVFPVSENHVFRHQEFFKVHSTLNHAGESVTKIYGKFLVLRNDRNTVDPDGDVRPHEVLENGLTIKFVRDEDGKSLEDIYGVAEIAYRRVLRSASQFRTAKFLMTEETLYNAVRTHASYGWIDRLEGRTFSTIAKVEPYISLALSSSLAAGTGYTDINTDDVTTEISIQGAYALSVKEGKNHIVRYDEVKDNDMLKVQLTDGASLISPRAMAKACYEAGIIYGSDYTLIKAGFSQGMSWKEQASDAILGPIWAKIPAAIQFRYGLKKGLANLFDHGYVDAKGNQFDFVFPDGAVKGEVKRFENVWKDGKVHTIDHGDGATDEEVELSLNATSPLKEKKWGALNYQFILSLNLDFTNDLQPLASKAIRHIFKALDSVENAMAFIGMVDGGDDEAYAEQNEAQRLRAFLNASPRIFEEKYIQKKIKSLMKKRIADMAKGRIPIEDARFVYISPDLNALDNGGTPLLKAGEFFYNGQTGKRAFFRSPLVHRSESSAITLVTSPELEEAYGHMKNVLIFNLFDDTLPRAGGADADGDKVLLTSEPAIVNAVEHDLPLVYGDTEEQKLKDFVWSGDEFQKILEYDKNTLRPSEIGRITDFCTAIADRMRSLDTHPAVREDLDKYLMLGRIQQGKIIDDPKRGTKTMIDSRIEQKAFPLWMGKHKAEVRESYSPMARLDKWIKQVVMPAFDVRFGKLSDYRANILLDYTDYDPTLFNEILGSVKNLESSYRQDVGEFIETHGEPPTPENFATAADYKEAMEQRDMLFTELIERHVLLLSMVEAPTALVGLACLHAAGGLGRTEGDKAPSYPFIIGEEFLVALLSDLPNNFRLARAYHVDGGLFTPSVAVRDNVIVTASGEEIGMTKNVEDGIYETHTFNDGFYLKVPQNVISIEVKRPEVNLIQFEAKGYKPVASLSADEFSALVQENPVTLQDIYNENGRFLGIIVDGRQVAAVGKETLMNANFAKGRELKVLKTQAIRGVVKVTAVIVGQEQVLETIETAVTTSYASADEEYHFDDSSLAFFDSSVGM